MVTAIGVAISCLGPRWLLLSGPRLTRQDASTLGKGARDSLRDCTRRGNRHKRPLLLKLCQRVVVNVHAPDLSLVPGYFSSLCT